MDRGIRVNAVACGPVWTPLVPAGFPEEKVGEFGKEIAPAFVLLACDDSSYITGQVLHPNGGDPVGS